MIKKLLSNFKTKLIATFVLILVIPSLVVGVLAYDKSKQELEQQIMNSARENVRIVNSIISNSMQSKMIDAEYLSNNINSSMYEGEESPAVRELYEAYIGMHPDVSSISLGTETGDYIRTPRDEQNADFDPRTRDWYKSAMADKGKVIITNPYVSAITGEMVVTVSRATPDQSGVVAVTLGIEQMEELARSVNIGQDGYVIILDENKNIVVHPTEESGTEGVGEYYTRMYEEEAGEFKYNYNGVEKGMYFTTNEVVGWKVSGTINLAEMDEAASPIFVNTFITIIICMIVGGAIIYFILQSILKPIIALKKHALRVSKGNLTETISINSNDEIGELGAAFNEMQHNLRSLIQDVESRSELVASSAEQLKVSSEQTSEATNQVAIAIQEVAESAEKQTSGLDYNSNALNEISQGVNKIVESVTIVSDLSKYTSSHAEEGGEAINEVVKQMHFISESVEKSDRMIRSLYDRSKEISSISGVISGISQQTNLLALNASIEAARAGEHGKGFAVVADEVRKLAEQSQTSAQQISNLIIEIQKETKNSVETMDKVTHDVENGLEVSNNTSLKFERILVSMRQTMPHIDEVSAITQQISAGVQEIIAVADDMALIAKGNAATSEEVAASTEEQLASMQEISSSAQSLAALSDELKKLINKFTY